MPDPTRYKLHVTLLSPNAPDQQRTFAMRGASDDRIEVYSLADTLAVSIEQPTHIDVLTYDGRPCYRVTGDGAGKFWQVPL